MRRRLAALVLAMASLAGCVGYNRPTRYAAVVIDGGLIVGGGVALARTDPGGGDLGDGLQKVFTEVVIGVGVVGLLATLLVYGVQHSSKDDGAFCYETVGESGRTERRACFATLDECLAAHAGEESAASVTGCH